MTFRIAQAMPIAQRLLISIAGPQASGKTTSALRLATGIVRATGGKILVIDTERKRALTYARNFNFMHLELDMPYSPDRYSEAVEYAQQQGFSDKDVIVIDSMSHEHEGPGGVLEMHEQYLDDKAGNDWKKRDNLNMIAWNYAKKGRKRLIHYTLAQAKPHVILCFRAKEKVAMVKDDKGKTKVVTNGFEPIGGQEYFFETQIAIILPEGAAGRADWSEKSSRINEFGDGPLKRLLHQDVQISEETGFQLAKICAVHAEQTIVDRPDTDTSQKPKLSNPTVEAAKEIIATFKTYTSADTLREDFDGKLHEKLQAIKKQSENTYNHVFGEYDRRITELSDQ